jgi:hypothetical protein
MPTSKQINLKRKYRRNKNRLKRKAKTEAFKRKHPNYKGTYMTQKDFKNAPYFANPDDANL